MGMVKCRFLEEKEFSLGQKGKKIIYTYIYIYIKKGGRVLRWL